jgi:hypothetical protein
MRNVSQLRRTRRAALRPVTLAVSGHWACRDDLSVAPQMGLVPKLGDAAQPRQEVWSPRPRPARTDARGQGVRHTTATPDGSHDPAPATHLARLLEAAGPCMAWVGIPLIPTPGRGDDRR